MKFRSLLVISILLIFSGGSIWAAQDVQIYQPSSQTGYLGVMIRDVTADDVTDLMLRSEKGVLVESVEPDSPAAEAGIQESDVLNFYEQTPVLSARQFRRLVAETPVGRTVEIGVWRAGSQVDLKAQISERSHGRWPGKQQGYSFKVPEFDIEPYLQGDHRFFLHTRKPRLGIGATELSDQMAEFLQIPGQQGVLILEVFDDSPAARAGLKAGDVVASVDGHEVTDPGELSRHLDADEVELRVFREGRELRLTASLSKQEKSERTGSVRM